MRCLHTITSVVNCLFPKVKVQGTIPNGTKLLPVADLTVVLYRLLIGGNLSF